MHKRCCAKCTIQPLRGLSSTGGCMLRRTLSLRSLGCSSTDTSHQGLKHFLIQVRTQAGMIQIIPYSCKYFPRIFASTWTNYICGSMVFHWVFIPWLQEELNNYKDCINHSRKCLDRKKVRPPLGHIIWLIHLQCLLQRFYLMESQNSYSLMHKTMAHWTLRWHH